MIDSVAQTPSLAAAATAETSRDAIGKEGFLQLLTTQLAHQDPLNPLDDTAFVSQLAQFSSLEQLMMSNDKLALMQMSFGATANAQNTTLIGRTVTARGDSLELTGEGAPAIQLQVSAAAHRAEIDVVDASGKTVRTVSVGSLGEGVQRVGWDGLDDTGAPLPAGQYSVRVRAFDAQDNAVTAAPLLEGVVSSVSFESGSAMLLVNGKPIRPADVLEVK